LQAWEFQHPEFQKDGKDALDNIRRKAPAPRKPNNAMDDSFPAQQIDLLNTQLVATQHQLQHMQERYNDLAQGHVVLLQQVVQLQKIVKNHDGAMQRVMGFLHSVDAQRRNSRLPFAPNGAPNGGMGVDNIISHDEGSADHPASPLQQASELLGEFSAENLVNKDLEQMTAEFSYRNHEFSASPGDHSATSSTIPPTTAGHNNNAMGYMNGDMDMVYPVGHDVGIDPVNSAHIHNIPYAMPEHPPANLNGQGQSDLDTIAQPAAAATGEENRKKSLVDPGWGPRKPYILLVEDDKTCARIGCKFLHSFHCGVETAVGTNNRILGRTKWTDMDKARWSGSRADDEQRQLQLRSGPHGYYYASVRRSLGHGLYT
jgi:osomolarity two-component system response regulator SKN7